MKPRFVLDTDTVVDAIRGRRSVVARLHALSPDDIAIAAVTVSELRYAAAIGRDAARRMRATAAFIDQVAVLPFAVGAALIHAELRLALRRSPIDPISMIVAATALAVPAVLVTSNAREAARISNLQVESWR